MLFPDSDRQYYEKNPLEEVICQLRFPTILQISAETPAQFQNAIRSEYPIYRLDSGGGHTQPELPDGLPEEIARLAESMVARSSTTKPLHRFSTADEQRIIVLNEGFIAYSENSYQRWEKFRDALDQAIVALKQFYQPAFFSRIGLRYRDVVDREQLGLTNYGWDDLLNHEFIGALGAASIGKEIEDIRTQVLVRIPEVNNGFVRIQHGLSTRPDKGEPVYIIDADFFTSERTQLNDAKKILDRFNKSGGNFFRWAISDTLRAALQPRDL